MAKAKKEAGPVGGDDPLDQDLSEFVNDGGWQRVRFIMAPKDTTVTMRLPQAMVRALKDVVSPRRPLSGLGAPVHRRGAGEACSKGLREGLATPSPFCFNIPHAPRPPHSSPRPAQMDPANARDLPWACMSDPYSILVSELMLQQTQVKTVLPYYAKFLKTFPTAGSLRRRPRRRCCMLGLAWAITAARASCRRWRRLSRRGASSRIPSRGYGPCRAWASTRRRRWAASRSASLRRWSTARSPGGLAGRSLGRGPHQRRGRPEDQGHGPGHPGPPAWPFQPSRDGAGRLAVLAHQAGLPPLCPLQPHCAAFMAGKPKPTLNCPPVPPPKSW